MKSHTFLECFSVLGFSIDGSVELEGGKEFTEEYTVMYGPEASVLFTFQFTSFFLKMKMVVFSWDVCLGHMAYFSAT